MVNTLAKELQRLYEHYKSERAPALVKDIAKFRKQLGGACVSPPLLVEPFREYENASPRIVLVGQSTFGWSWPTKEYPEWSHQAIWSFNDFAADEKAVSQLMKGYKWFDFCARQLRNRNGPFWRFYRRMLHQLDLPVRAAVWTNLFRLDVAGSPPEEPMTSSALTFQQDLLRKELEILNPDLVIFTTGWRYDPIIGGEFGQIRKYPIAGIRERLLCRIKLPGQPFLTLRTYHPAYLSWNGSTKMVLDQISRHVR
jgi:hypothetical protein